MAMGLGSYITLDNCEMQCPMNKGKSDCCNTGTGAMNASCCNTEIKCSISQFDITTPISPASIETPEHEVGITASLTFIINNDQPESSIKQFVYQHIKPPKQINFPLLN